MSPQELAKRIGKTIKTLGRWRTAGGGPPFVKVGGTIDYPPEELTEWLAARVVLPRAHARLTVDALRQTPQTSVPMCMPDSDWFDELGPLGESRE